MCVYIWQVYESIAYCFKFNFAAIHVDNYLSGEQIQVYNISIVFIGLFYYDSKQDFWSWGNS